MEAKADCPTRNATFYTERVLVIGAVLQADGEETTRTFNASVVDTDAFWQASKSFFLSTHGLLRLILNCKVLVRDGVGGLQDL